MSKFEVIVSNIGTVYSGHSLVKAKRSFAEYVAQSKTMRGRAGGESVTLMDNDEPINEHFGEDDVDENPHNRAKRNPRANYAADYFDRDKTMTPTEWARSMSELRAGKPRPIAKLYGRNGPTELQAMNHAAEMRAWNSLYNYAKKMYHKTVLDRENTLFDSSLKYNPRHAGAELKIEKILNSDLSDARKISQLQILALKSFPSSPNQKKVIAAYQALQSTKRNPIGALRKGQYYIIEMDHSGGGGQYGYDVTTPQSWRVRTVATPPRGRYAYGLPRELYKLPAFMAWAKKYAGPKYTLIDSVMGIKSHLKAML